MSGVFADTFYFLSLLNPADDASLPRQILPGTAPFD
jgi:hypothetical protein